MLRQTTSRSSLSRSTRIGSIEVGVAVRSRDVVGFLDWGEERDRVLFDES